jgi:hypothetical protein
MTAQLCCSKRQKYTVEDSQRAKRLLSAKIAVVRTLSVLFWHTTPAIALERTVTDMYASQSSAFGARKAHTALPAQLLTSAHPCVRPAGASTTLTLNLVAPVEPQYGPDFTTLTVLLEPQTPQRLHVKISPAGGSTAAEGGNGQQGSRWEVPEWLLPR